MERKMKENLNSLHYTNLINTNTLANINTVNKLWERNFSVFTQKEQ